VTFPEIDAKYRLRKSSIGATGNSGRTVRYGAAPASAVTLGPLLSLQELQNVLASSFDRVQAPQCSQFTWR
jgi:hypothetical protein